MVDLESKEFLESLKRKDHSSFRKLVDSTQGLVINTAYRFLLNRQDSEDLAQEVYCEVYNSINQFNAKAKITTWIYRITVSKSMDKIRSSKRQKRSSIHGKDLSIEDASNVSSSDDVHVGMENREKLDLIFKAMASFPENQRVAFTLSRIDGLDNSEIAEIMNLSLVAIESLIYRAKKRITQEVKEFYVNDARN